ncbi:MAG: hypothetical protein OJF62_000798 [Pseudolabrys sp.]|nr:hypothetical protein [Pseudolabrys sp.]
MIGFFPAAGKAAALGLVVTMGIALAGCSTAPGETPRAAALSFPAPASRPAAPAQTAQVQAQPDKPTLKPYEANAKCWMKYDQSKVSLDTKAKLVDKCVDDIMRAQGTPVAAPPKSATRTKR